MLQWKLARQRTAEFAEEVAPAETIQSPSGSDSGRSVEESPEDRRAEWKRQRQMTAEQAEDLAPGSASPPVKGLSGPRRPERPSRGGGGGGHDTGSARSASGRRASISSAGSGGKSGASVAISPRTEAATRCCAPNPDQLERGMVVAHSGFWYPQERSLSRSLSQDDYQQPLRPVRPNRAGAGAGAGAEPSENDTPGSRHRERVRLKESGRLSSADTGDTAASGNQQPVKDHQLAQLASC